MRINVNWDNTSANCPSRSWKNIEVEMSATRWKVPINAQMNKSNVENLMEIIHLCLLQSLIWGRCILIATHRSDVSICQFCLHSGAENFWYLGHASYTCTSYFILKSISIVRFCVLVYRPIFPSHTSVFLFFFSKFVLL